ncbi:MAG: type I 3-dehydroquinate dehydratase [Planctomycetota bacterium]|nr:type I 3-dehydroquinate dehydratase [Planctomycetota bacterium]
MSPGGVADFPLRGVVGVLDGAAADDVLAGRPLPDGLGGVELRADLAPSAEAALDVLSRLATRLPVLFTVRLATQGGAYRGSEAKRLGLYRRALERGAALVDAEWGSEAARALAMDSAPLVLSYHDFDGMPAPADLSCLTAEMESLEPRALKVVPTAKVLHDSARMLEWLGQRGAAAPIRIGFAMGEKGIPSRVLSIARGAPCTYGAVRGAVAPGQLSVEDLTGLYRVGSLGPSTVLLGIVGNPVAHSLSPHLHNPALRAAGVDAVYVPLRLDRIDELEPCWEPLGLRGVSVTIPFKEEAFRRADQLDERSRAARAANTLVRDERGRLSGHNTDFDGVLEPLRERLETLQGVSAAVIGNGGAARGAVEALKQAGAAPTLYFRNAGRGTPVAEELQVPGQLLEDFVPEIHRIIINATALGMQPGDPSPLGDNAFATGTVAFDMVYDPPETAFLLAARRSGAETIGGGEMLVAQGLVQFRLFTGRDADRDVFEKGLDDGLRSREGARRQP